ncbi:DUF2461 domain-containing protein [Oleiphilus messinensis]|nr:DUF2461 domain-containing protein [Oleiphilus messinensis]
MLVSTSFSGFEPSFFSFFTELKANNNKSWFSEHKVEYERCVVEPIQAFIEAMSPRLYGISPYFIASPKKVGGSMFRIYRDVRFSKDKRPYKEHGACQFRHEAGKDAHAPGFYLHLAPDEVLFGGGVWLPGSPQLLKIRERIVAKPDEWTAVLENTHLHKHFPDGVSGEPLTRPPRGFKADQPHLEDIKRKSFYLMARTSAKEAQSIEFINEVAEAYGASSPLMRFLCGAVDVSF